jgi:outer membrane protein OmpA-like peptidoglycan-associated protein
MNKLKLIGLIFLIIFSTTSFAQEKSEIVMTKSELESFLNTIADARRSQIEAKNEDRAKNELAELRYQYNNGIDSRRTGNRDISNYEILRELDRLNARLDYMNSRNSGMLSNGKGSSSTLVVPGGSNSPGYIPYNQGQQLVPGQDLVTAKSIWELERKLDSLKSVQANLPPSTKTENQEIADLKNQFQSLEQKLANTQNPTERRSLLEELLAKFKNFKKQVFFANNSDQLSSNDFAYIQDVAQVLKQYPELSIVLEGWASTSGKLDYNKQLSMRRSESVEQALLSNGISPVRIVSSFRGEDKSSTAAMARRVDMSIILK